MSSLIVLALILSLPMLQRGLRMAALLPITVFQIYLPGLTLGDTPISLAFVLSCSFWPDAIREARAMMNFRPTLLLLGLLLITIVSFVWSVDLHRGLVTLNTLVGFLIVYAGAVAQARRSPEWIIRGMRLLAFAALFLAFSVIVFRLIPMVKMGFLQSPVGNIFINANTLEGLFTDGADNVIDPQKSGGFAAVNANAVATYLGMLAMMLFGLARAYRYRLFDLVFPILLVTIPFTGSKAGILLIGVMVGLLTLIYLMRKSSAPLRGLVALSCVFVLLLAGVWSPMDTAAAEGSFRSNVQGTTDSRLLIWDFALRNMVKSPWLGQGFGGWQETFPSYARQVGLTPTFPPHDTFLYLWSQSGMLAMLLGFAFAVLVLKRAIGLMRHANDERRGLAIGLGMGFLWVTAQGLGENSGLLGESHMAMVLAVMLALFRARSFAVQPGRELV